MGSAREIPQAGQHGVCYQCGSRSLYYSADDGHHKCLICGRAQRVVPPGFGGELPNELVDGGLLGRD